MCQPYWILVAIFVFLKLANKVCGLFYSKSLIQWFLKRLKQIWWIYEQISIQMCTHHGGWLFIWNTLVQTFKKYNCRKHLGISVLENIWWQDLWRPFEGITTQNCFTIIKQRKIYLCWVINVTTKHKINKINWRLSYWKNILCISALL